MSKPRKMVPLWLMHVLGILFIFVCQLGVLYSGVPDWIRWPVLAVSLYIELKAVAFVRTRRSGI